MMRMFPSTFACTACEGKRPAIETCAPCAGRGVPTNLSYCPDPWNEIIPFLWVGGHDYDPPLIGSMLRGRVRPAGTAYLAEEGFEVVVSLYQRNGFAAPAGVDEQCLSIPDHWLEDEDIEAVHALADHVARSVADNKKTLVRCQAGINRSSLVAALAMVRLGWNPEDAIARIRVARDKDCLCNSFFVSIIRGELAAESV